MICPGGRHLSRPEGGYPSIFWSIFSVSPRKIENFAPFFSIGTVSDENFAPFFSPVTVSDGNFEAFFPSGTVSNENFEAFFSFVTVSDGNFAPFFSSVTLSDDFFAPKNGFFHPKPPNLVKSDHFRPLDPFFCLPPERCRRRRHI